jgi:hypothetical protein
VSEAVAGELLVVHVIDDPRPFFDVRVDAVAPTGAVQTVASFYDVHPASWTEAAPMYDADVSIGPGGKLLVVAERAGGAEPGDAVGVLLDLRDPFAAPVAIAAVPHGPAWGPTGGLAWRGNAWQVADTTTGVISAAPVPTGVEPVPAWLVDGGGWLGLRHDDRLGAPEVGALRTTGEWQPGIPQLFEWSGLERRVGAAGGVLSMAVSDGFQSSETALIERRLGLGGPCRCQVWLRSIEPGDDPRFGNGVWDAARVGVWAPMADPTGGQRWLVHLATPGVDTLVTRLPDNGDWQIVGLSRDDGWVVLSGEEAGELVLVDTSRGEVVVVLSNGEVTSVHFGAWRR